MRSAHVPLTLGSPRSRMFEVAEFAVIHAWFPSDTVLDMHTHEHAGLVVMLNGAFELAFRGRRLSCPPGTVVTEPAGERHANQMSSRGAEVLVIQQRTTLPTALMPLAATFTDISHQNRPEVRALASRVTREIRYPDALTPLATEGLVLQMITTAARRSESARKAGRAPSWLRRVQDRLHAVEGGIPNMAELASIADVGPVQLARAFRKQFGIPVGAYARRARLERCAELLVNSANSLAMIAADTGFADQAHFTRAFKLHYGITPRAYRTGQMDRTPDG